MKNTYIHFGDSQFRPDKMRGCKNVVVHPCKPSGLWASPINARYGWKKWCESEDFHTERLNASFTFQLSDSARILHIRKIEDAEAYLKEEETGSTTTWKLNRSILYDRFDGMELHITEDWNGFRGNKVFLTWDVDSICIWNPEVILPE